MTTPDFEERRFHRSVLTILGGTSAAMGIALLATPLLARIYTPSDFGAMALCVSVASVLAIAITGRYETAILLPKSDATAASLAIVSLLLALAGVVLFSLGAMAYSSASAIVGTPAIAVPLWGLAIPTMALGIAFIQTLTYWQNRQQNYKAIAQGRAGQALGMTVSQLGLGYLKLGQVGLIAGYLAGAAICVHRLWPETPSLWTGRWRRSLRTRLSRAASRYVDFPRFMIAGHLANALSTQMPVLLLTAFFGPREAGLYAMAERLTAIPTAVVMNSVGEVYREIAARQYASDGNCRSLFLSSLRKLLLLAIPLCIGIAVLAPIALPVLLGASWAESGIIAAVLAPYILMQSISSPLSQTVMIAGWLRIDLLWQVARLVVASSCIPVAYLLGMDHTQAIATHVGGFCLVYAAHTGLQYAAASGATRKVG